jgi:hypothetical protein
MDSVPNAGLLILLIDLQGLDIDSPIDVPAFKPDKFLLTPAQCAFIYNLIIYSRTDKNKVDSP